MDIREAIIYKNIFGGGGSSNAMVEHKLTYNGTAIKLGDTTQTFAQVKSACEDATKFVFLVYENRLYIPQYVYNDRIYFTCTYPTETSGVMTRRIAMMSNNTVTVNNTELQPKLTAGDNISIENNVISATGGGGEEVVFETELTEDVTGSIELTLAHPCTEIVIYINKLNFYSGGYNYLEFKVNGNLYAYQSDIHAWTTEGTGFYCIKCRTNHGMALTELWEGEYSPNAKPMNAVYDDSFDGTISSVKISMFNQTARSGAKIVVWGC